MRELEQIERPLIAYSLCFDDVMKTFLSMHDIAYDKAFSYCWEFEYTPSEGAFSDTISFPHAGFKKYCQLGIKLRKLLVNGDTELWKVISDVKDGKIVPIHYDGFYCPWDQLQKKRRWHNSHTVLAYMVDETNACFHVDDPFYRMSNQCVPFSSFGTATKFYLSISLDEYQDRSYKILHGNCMRAVTDFEIFSKMEHFLLEFKSRIHAGNYNGIFDEMWVKTIEKGYMTRHYLWLFYKSLYRETGEMKYGRALLLFYSVLQAWKECVTQSHKGWRSRDKAERGKLFAEAFARVIEAEKTLFHSLNADASCGDKIISETVPAQDPIITPIMLAPLFNSRACKLLLRDKRKADITGEGEYIHVEKKFRTNVRVGALQYPVCFGEERDHICCAGQKLTLSESYKFRGVAFLVCSEWGRSLFSVTFIGKRWKFYSDCVLNDFTNRKDNSVRVGSSYLSGKKKDVLFQKDIFLQSIYFSFPQDDEIVEIELPDCISVHLFSAVLVK